MLDIITGVTLLGVGILLGISFCGPSGSNSTKRETEGRPFGSSSARRELLPLDRQSQLRTTGSGATPISTPQTTGASDRVKVDQQPVARRNDVPWTKHVFPSPAPHSDFCEPPVTTLTAAQTDEVVAAGFDDVSQWTPERRAVLDALPCFLSTHKAPGAIRVQPVKVCGEPRVR